MTAPSLLPIVSPIRSDDSTTQPSLGTASPTDGQDFSQCIQQAAGKQNAASQNLTLPIQNGLPRQTGQTDNTKIPVSVSGNGTLATTALPVTATNDDTDDSAEADSTNQKPKGAESSTNASANLDAALASTIMALMTTLPVTIPIQVKTISLNLAKTGDATIGEIPTSSTAAQSKAVSDSATNFTASEALPLVTEMVAQLEPGGKENSGIANKNSALLKNPAPAINSSSSSGAVARQPASDTAKLSIVGMQTVENQPDEMVEAVAATQLNPNGMSAALIQPRMKFATETIEIAGRVGQKLPGATSSDDVSTLAATAVAEAAPELGDRRKNFSADNSINLDFSGKPATSAVDGPAEKPVAPTVSSQFTAQAERLTQLVTHQISNFRQSGTDNLSVSLKVDAQTELNLQLTNHNGQMQATIRFDRGDAAGLNAHWNDLQQSLSRQNVQLLPLETKTSNTAPLAANATQTPGAAQNNQFSQNFRQPAKPSVEEPEWENSRTVRNQPVQTGAIQKSSRNGWETWA